MAPKASDKVQELSVRVNTVQVGLCTLCKAQNHTLCLLLNLGSINALCFNWSCCLLLFTTVLCWCGLWNIQWIISTHTHIHRERERERKRVATLYLTDSHLARNQRQQKSAKPPKPDLMYNRVWWSTFPVPCWINWGRLGMPRAWQFTQNTKNTFLKPFFATKI